MWLKSKHLFEKIKFIVKRSNGDLELDWKIIDIDVDIISDVNIISSKTDDRYLPIIFHSGELCINLYKNINTDNIFKIVPIDEFYKLQEKNIYISKNVVNQMNFNLFYSKLAKTIPYYNY